jgi:EAL domain-containing protein (putative c-di-GMP-specific phosphodiesterase class I)
MSLATLVDPGFHEYLKQALVEYEVDGNFFCFEMPLCDLAFRAADLAEFAKQSKLCGCSVSLSGFGRDQVRFEQIQGMQVDFLKIDGTIVSDICSDLVKLSQVIAIQRVTQKIGIRTIAELAENEETIEKLKEIGIDYAQGFEISRPLPLDDIKLS